MKIQALAAIGDLKKRLIKAETIGNYPIKAWTQEEESSLIKAIRAHKKDWDKITNILEPRSKQACKNKTHCLKYIIKKHQVDNNCDCDEQCIYKDDLDVYSILCVRKTPMKQFDEEDDTIS